ncbi:hypothetical protein J6590_015290 [Homalodisca vitripennis]|nr:hypothetical protein J6590_015290 [Homalodisca vitripennis]
MSRVSIQLALTLVIIVFVAVSGSPTSPNVTKEDLRLLKNHHNRLAPYSCREPRPTVVPLPSSLHGVMHIPVETVLHRCDNSGCCPRGKTCMSLTVERVDLVFLLPHTNGTEEFEGTKGFIKHFPFNNHTACACGEKKSKRSRLIIDYLCKNQFLRASYPMKFRYGVELLHVIYNEF